MDEGVKSVKQILDEIEEAHKTMLKKEFEEYSIR